MKKTFKSIPPQGDPRYPEANNFCEVSHRSVPWFKSPLYANTIQAQGKGTNPDNFICTMAGSKFKEANLAFIVRACNSHAALVEALGKVVRLCDDADADEMTRQAARIAGNALKLATS